MYVWEWACVFFCVCTSMCVGVSDRQITISFDLILSSLRLSRPFGLIATRRMMAKRYMFFYMDRFCEIVSRLCTASFTQLSEAPLEVMGHIIPNYNHSSPANITTLDYDQFRAVIISLRAADWLTLHEASKLRPKHLYPWFSANDPKSKIKYFF